MFFVLLHHLLKANFAIQAQLSCFFSPAMCLPENGIVVLLSGPTFRSKNVCASRRGADSESWRRMRVRPNTLSYAKVNFFSPHSVICDCRYHKRMPNESTLPTKSLPARCTVSPSLVRCTTLAFTQDVLQGLGCVRHLVFWVSLSRFSH